MRVGTPQLTDDAGRFRVYGLEPGQFYLLATPLSWEGGERPAPGYSPTFYPGALSATPEGAITLAAGQQLSGLRFPIVPVPTGSVSGVVVGEAVGSRAALLTVRRLQTTGSLTMAAALSTTMAAPGGAFSYEPLAPGTYQILASRDGYVGVQQVEVSHAERVSDVVITLRAGATVRGTINASPGAATTLDPARVRLSLVSTDPFDAGVTGQPAIASDGGFRWAGVHTARAFVRAVAPGWLLERVVLRGVDVTDVPVTLSEGTDDLEVVLTDRASGLTGAVLDEAGQPARHVPVVVFADDSAHWGRGSRFFARVSTDADGRFSAGELPPGRYRVLALRALDRGDEMNPELLEQWRVSAERVDIAAGGMHRVQLRVLR